MTIYFCAYAILIFTYFLFKSPQMRSKKSEQLICITFFAVLTLILGLRHPSMGYDLRYGEELGYLGMYEYISELSWSKIFSFVSVLNYEYGYIFYNKLLSVISDDPQILLFATTAISIAPVIYVIYKKKVNQLLSIFVYIGLPSFLIIFSGLRQSIAIALCFLSILFIEQKKFFRFAAIVLLAWLFHSSSIVFLVAYPLYYLKLNRNARYLSVLLIPIVYIFRYPLFNILSTLFKESAVAYDTGAVTLLIVFSLVYIFCMLFMDHGNVEHNGYMNLFMCACLCQVFGNIYDTAMRVGYYFMIVLVLLLPKIIYGMKLYTNRTVSKLAVNACFVAYGLSSIYSSTWAMAYPHIFFWVNI